MPALPRFRLSLRTLCLLFIASAIGLAWLLAPAVKLRQRAAALKSLEPHIKWREITNDTDAYSERLAWCCGLPRPFVVSRLVLLDATDADCRALGAFPELTHLKLGNSPRVTNAGVQALAGLQQLQEVALEAPLLDDQIAPTIAGWPAVTILAIEQTQCGDGVLQVCTTLPELRSVAGGLQSTDVGLAALMNSRTINWIELDGTQVNGSAIVGAAENQRLLYLMLQHAQLSPAALQGLVKFPKLAGLDLRGSTMSQAIIPVLAKLPELQFAALDLGTWSPEDCSTLARAAPALNLTDDRTLPSTGTETLDFLRTPTTTGVWFNDETAWLAPQIEVYYDIRPWNAHLQLKPYDPAWTNVK